MRLLQDLAAKYRTVSIVGMAKNAGKTTALNYLIEEAMDAGMTLGITSTGRDGENTDLVTGTEKPRVYLEAGTLVSVTTQLYELAEAGLEILRMTNYHTSIGRLMLCRVAESGYVQIAGPVITAEHKALCAEMLALGAKMVLIDGAVDRKSIAGPETSDAIILATGAVLSRNAQKVAEETAHIVGICSLQKLPGGRCRELIEANASREKIMLVEKGVPRVLDLKTGLAAGRLLDAAISDETEYVYLPGAVTQSVIADIQPAKLKNICFVLKDPTRIFIDAAAWRQLRKKGLRVKVMENIKVAAITVNPCAPQGYSFERETLLTAVRSAIPDLPVLDVRMDWKQFCL